MNCPQCKNFLMCQVHGVRRGLNATACIDEEPVPGMEYQEKKNQILKDWFHDKIDDEEKDQLLQKLNIAEGKRQAIEEIRTEAMAVKFYPDHSGYIHLQDLLSILKKTQEGGK